MELKFLFFLFILNIFLIPSLLAKQGTICIIGGGPAGTATALELIEMGYKKRDIHLFEKNNYFGGKCNSESVNGEIIEMGAVLAPPTYYYVRYHADHYNAKFIPHPRLKVLSHSSEGENFSLKSFEQYYGVPHFYSFFNPFNGLLKSMLTYDKFSKMCVDKEMCIYKKNIPEELFTVDSEGQKTLKSFQDFSDNVGISQISPWFEIFVNSFGYLPLTKIPALYVLGYVPSSFSYYGWLSGIAETRRLKNGYSHLITTALFNNIKAAHLHLGQEVVSIDRNSSQLSYLKKGVIYQQKCNHFIIATEPGAIKDALGTQASSFEQRLFDEVNYSPYRTLVAKSNLPYGIFVIGKEAHDYKPGDAVLIGNVFYQYPNSDMRDTLFYFAEDHSSIKRTTEEVHRHLQEQMKRYGFTISDVVMGTDGRPLDRKWPTYFPHYKDPDLIGSIDSYQGKNSTYYVGGAYTTFELVGNSMDHAVRIVHTYFADKDHPIPSDSRFISDRNWFGIPAWGREELKDDSF